MKNLTSREEYIKKTFFYNLEKNEAFDVVKKISEIGNLLGFIGTNISKDQQKNEKRKHKYDVWISKEVKKDPSILNKKLEIRLIIDWVVNTKTDIFKHSFKSAFKAQEEWHEDMKRKYHIENMNIPKIDENRVVFRFSDKKHFLYLLNEKDLKHEGSIMGHCVGGKNYKSKLRNKQSLILSIRDLNNMPHVTIEVDTDSKKTIQKYGKSSKPPAKKYLQMYSEYVFYATSFKGLKNKDTLKFLNLEFGKNNDIF